MHTTLPYGSAEIIFGAVIDDSLGDEVRVTVIATGFSDPVEKKNTVQDAFAGMQNFLNTQPIQMPSLNIPPPSMNPVLAGSGLNFELPPISAVQTSVTQFTHEMPAVVEDVVASVMMPPQQPTHVVYAQPQVAPQPIVTQQPVAVQAPQMHSTPPTPPASSAVHHAPISAPEAIVPNESLLNARDMLMAKARAFKESQDLKSKHTSERGPEQLSMMMESESASLEEARKMARDVLSSSFHGQNLEVPSFIRKRQNMESENKSE